MNQNFLRELARKAVAGMSEGTNADGGYLISNDMAKGVIDNIFKRSPRLNHVSRYLVGPGSNSIKIPAVVDPLQSSPSTGTRAFWQSEAQAIAAVGGAAPAASKAVFSSPTLTLSNIVTLVPITNELVEDVNNIDEIITDRLACATSRLLARDMMFGRNAIKGVADSGLGHAASLSTTVSATPSDAQLKVMFGLLHPTAICGATWYVSQAVYTALFGAAYTSMDKTYGNLTILGLPVEIDPYMTSAPAHICLGNFAGYAMAYKDPTLAKSLTLYFNTNQSAFRLVWRVAGDAQTANTVCEDTVTRGYFVYPSGS